MPAPASFSLDGRVALVTGASSGIGREIALALVEAGAAVVLVARREAELERARTEIASARGRASTIVANLADRAEVRAAAREAGKPFGPPDILVNAAGINIRKPMLEVTESDWDAVLRVNLDASFFLGQALAPAMIERGWGRIVNIASLQSARAFPMGAAYGASKGAIAQLTRAQAQEFSRHGITCNAIAPGFFATGLTEPVVKDAARWKKMAEGTFIGRNGELADLRGAAVFLASPASSYITGQVLFVDGGFSAG
jgi:NAD(P)-dependent dehydrogenase (short-subunit alcohol dehydrogenase family)